MPGSPQPPGPPPGYGGPPGGSQQPGWAPQPPSGGGGNANTTLIVILVVLLVAAGGFGVFVLTQDDDEGGGGGGGGTGDSETAEGQEYVDAIVDDPGTLADLPGISEEDVPCIARAVVDSVGVENIPYSPEEIREGAGDDWEPTLSQQQAEAYYDSAAACGVDWRGGFLDGMAGEGLTDSQLACVDEVMSDDLIRQTMVARLLGEQGLPSEAETALEQCRGA
jgi:hypothetical protein